MSYSNLTDYNFADIATYAHGVKPDLDLLVYYPSVEPTQIDQSSQADFVTEMHALDMAVHTHALRAGLGTQYDLSDVALTKLVTVKGVDGIYTDFASATNRAVNLIGSQSWLFREALPPSDNSA